MTQILRDKDGKALKIFGKVIPTNAQAEIWMEIEKNLPTSNPDDPSTWFYPVKS